MFWITDKATLVCKHEKGTIANQASQDWVRIESAPVLVESDPQGRPISGCPNIGPTIKPCLLTLAVVSGYSDWIRLGGRSLCLDTVSGLTDGTPPGTVEYLVRDSGQRLVRQL